MTDAPSLGAAPGVHDLLVADEEAGERLDLFLARRLATSRTQAATLVATANVTIDGRREKASWRIRSGENVRVEIPAPVGRAVEAEQIPLAVVYEDDALVVIDKLAGMVVHPAPGHWTGTLVNALLGRGQSLAAGGPAERPGLVHRIDKETSGLLVVAKTERAHRVLSAAIAARQITRRYAVACWGHVTSERFTVEKPVARDPRNRQRMAVVATGKPARTDFTRLARGDAGDLLRARLHTGRTHQIRVHLSSIGHPVLGDDVYGGGGGRRLVTLPPRRHFLHAAELRFRHPLDGREMLFRALLPADLRRALAAVVYDPTLAEDADPLEAYGFYADE